MYDSETVKALETALEQNRQADAKTVFEKTADFHDWLPLLKEAINTNNEAIGNGAQLPKLSITATEQERYPLTVYVVSSGDLKELQFSDWHNGRPQVSTADEIHRRGDQI